MSCDRHDEMIKRMDNHSDRLKVLELSDTETKTDLRNLISTVKELINWIKYFIGVTLVGSIGFIIWYIQKG